MDGMPVMPNDVVIVDGHEDLAMGALADGRNYLTSAHAITIADRPPWRRRVREQPVGDLLSDPVTPPVLTRGAHL
jgi:hypothetical protein